MVGRFDSSVCDICGKNRGHGNHKACAEKRRQFYLDNPHLSQHGLTKKPATEKRFAEGWHKHSKTRFVP